MRDHAHDLTNTDCLIVEVVTLLQCVAINVVDYEGLAFFSDADYRYIALTVPH